MEYIVAICCGLLWSVENSHLEKGSMFKLNAPVSTFISYGYLTLPKGSKSYSVVTPVQPRHWKGKSLRFSLVRRWGLASRLAT